MGWHLSWEAHLSTSGFLRGGVGPHQGNSPSSCLPPVLGPFQGLYGRTPRSPGFFGSGGRNGRPWKRQLRHRTGHPSLCLRSAQASHSVLGQLPSPNAGSPQPPPANPGAADRTGREAVGALEGASAVLPVACSPVARRPRCLRGSGCALVCVVHQGVRRGLRLVRGACCLQGGRSLQPACRRGRRGRECACDKFIWEVTRKDERRRVPGAMSQRLRWGPGVMQPGAHTPAPSVPRAFSGSQGRPPASGQLGGGQCGQGSGRSGAGPGRRSGEAEAGEGASRAGLGRAAGPGPGRRSWESVWETRRQVSARRPWGSWRPAEGPGRPGSGRGAGRVAPARPARPPSPGPAPQSPLPELPLPPPAAAEFLQVPPPLPGPARAPTSPRGSPGGGGRPCPPPRAAAAPGGAARGRRPWRAQDRAIAATCGTGD